jgi:hypothetical protein
MLTQFAACDSGSPSARESHGRVDTAQAVLILDIPGTSAAGDVQLEYPVAGTRLADGTVVIADGIAPAVRFFDAEGRLTRSVGREGEGPAEFGLLWWLDRCGPSTLAVWDIRYNQLTRLDTSGSFIDRQTLGGTAALPRSPSRLSCSPSGTLGLLAQPDLSNVGQGTGFTRLTAPLVLRTPSGEIIHLLDSALVTEWANAASTFRPLSPSTYTAFSDSLVAIGTSDTTIVRIYDVTGRHRSSFSVELPAHPATEHHAKQAAESQAFYISNATARARIVEELLLTIPLQERLPYYSGIYFDSAETLWLVLSLPGDSATSLRAYTTEGTTGRHIEVPVSLTVFDIGVDYVLGVYFHQASNEPHVAVYGF